MKKYLIGLTAASLLFSPLLFADTTPSDTMGQTQPITASPQPSTDQTDPATTDTSSAPTTPAVMPDTSSTTATTPTTNASTDSTLTDVQLKSMSGSIIPAKIDPQNLQGINVGDKLEVTNIGTTTPTNADAPISNDTTQ